MNTYNANDPIRIDLDSDSDSDVPSLRDPNESDDEEEQGEYNEVEFIRIHMDGDDY